MSNLQPHFSLPSTVSAALLHTASTQIEQRRSNFCLRFFGAVVFKFEPNLTIVTFVQKFVKCCSICVDMVYGKDSAENIQLSMVRKDAWVPDEWSVVYHYIKICTADLRADNFTKKLVPPEMGNKIYNTFFC